VTSVKAATLLHCPFCGASHVDLIKIHSDGASIVRCLNCGARTAQLQRDEAISRWNKRVETNG
jgi:Lar family restriction alleviation protein